MTMSEVAATGMEQLYPGVCSEDLQILMHTFSRRYVHIPTWADTLLVTHKGFLRPRTEGEWRWKPTFFVW